MNRTLKIGILTFLFFGFITGQGFALISIHVDFFDAFTPTIFKYGNGTVIMGVSCGPTAAGGVSVASVAEATSSASNSAWDCICGKYADASSVQGNQFWGIGGHLIGDPGEEAEIIANWRLWTQPLLYAYISNPIVSYASASARSHMDGCVYGINKDGYFDGGCFEALDEQEVEFFGVRGDSITETGSFSLGTFPVGEAHYFRIFGFLGVNSQSYASLGSAASSLLTICNLTLTTKKADEPIPEPSTLMLLGMSLLPLLRMSKNKVKKSHRNSSLS